jgi:HlyD family secretion protein
VALVDARRDFDRKTQLFQRDLIAKSDLDTAQATHDSAEAQLDAARAREQSLRAAIGSAQAQLRVVEAQLTSAQAQVTQKQAALRQAQVDLEHTYIRAPVDGVVVSRAVDVGQTVAASLQAPVLFTIAQDLTQMQVETSVDEADIGRIRLDGPATFTVDAFPNETFAGRVVQIRKAGQVVQNVVTYTVVVAVSNPEGKLLPGMTANVKLVVAEKPSVLKVPNSALRFRPPGADGDGAAAGGGARGSAGGGGGQSLEQMRERLVKTLNLTAEQQAKLDTVLQEARQDMAAARGAGGGEQDRQTRVQRAREGMRARIREILTPEQQARYDQMGGGGRSGGGTPGRIFALGPDGKPKAIALTLGLTDGTATEVLAGDLKEGQEVIVGTAGTQSGPRQPGSGGSGPRLRL